MLNMYKNGAKYKDKYCKTGQNTEVNIVKTGQKVYYIFGGACSCLEKILL